MPNPTREIFILLILTCFTNVISAQEANSSDFTSNFNLLMDGQIDSLSLGNLGFIRIVQFNNKGWEDFNKYELESTKNGKISLDRFRPIIKEDIISVNENNWVILLHQNHGLKIYVATISTQGIPMEVFLLHDHYGYLFEKTFRAFSFSKPVHFNPMKQAFEFYQLTYGYERIPTIESPTQDPIYHQTFNRVGFDENGKIELQLSESTGQQLFRREFVKLVPHELTFQEFSLTYMSEEGVTQSQIWKEEYITYGDMDSHDSITIHLEFESQWDNRFFFLKPAEGTTIIDVAQRHENILSFPGDGSTCSLPQWKRYRSSWRDLNCEENFFKTVSLDSEQRSVFSEYTQSELTKEFEKECGEVPSMESLQFVMEPSPRNTQIIVDRIVLRIKFKNLYGIYDKFILFQLSGGC